MMSGRKETRRGYMTGIGGLLASTALISTESSAKGSNSPSASSPKKDKIVGSLNDYEIIVGGVMNQSEIKEASSPGEVYDAQFSQGENICARVSFDQFTSPVYLSYGIQDKQNYYEVRVEFGESIQINKVLDGERHLIAQSELLNTNQQQLRLVLVWKNDGSHQVMVQNSLFFEEAVGHDQEWTSGGLGLACEQDGTLHWVSKNRPVVNSLGENGDRTLVEKIREKAKKEGPITNTSFDQNSLEITFENGESGTVQHHLKTPKTMILVDWDGKKFVFHNIDVLRKAEQKISNKFAEKLLMEGK